MVAEERQGATDPLAGLTAALKATPGCLGIGTAMTESGKQVIFAWFENKQAALAPGSLKSQVFSKFRNHRH